MHPAPRLLLLLPACLALGACRTVPDPERDAELSRLRSEEAALVDALKNSIFQPLSSSPEAEVGRLRRSP